MRLIACFLMLATGLEASSVEPWVGGTRTYETVSYLEANLALMAALRDTHSGGAKVTCGLTDHLMVDVAWIANDSLPQSQAAIVSGQYRLAEDGQWLADFAAFGELGRRWYSNSIQGDGYAGGLIVAKEISEFSLSVNASMDDGGNQTLRAGLRSPFLFWALRAGLEGHWGKGPGYLIPQIFFNLPGDIALQAGAAISGADEHPATWLLSLSYEIFPSP